MQASVRCETRKEVKTVQWSRPGEMFMLGKPLTRPGSDFVPALTSTDCSNPEVFVHVGLLTENSVDEFSMVPDN